MFDVNNLASIKIGLASPDKIRQLSHGEVTKPETINYRSQKPEMDGLFCERIFGPSKDFECHCGKYKKSRYAGVVCEKCGVEVISKEVRRERVGHIELASPCSHIWYLKGIPSRMALVLDMSPKDLEEIVYYSAHVCLNAGNSKTLQYKQFLDVNHIQGGINSSLRLGLFYQGELVSVIGFGKSRFKKGEYELHRYCSKLYTQVIGGFSKLIKHSGVNEFISYVDRSKFNGSGYMSIGFKILGYTEPSYVYIKNKEILRRMTCQKHKLSNILENYDETLTEEENMINNGYIKIYYCGNIKMIWT